jgi:hypothetical protein
VILHRIEGSRYSEVAPGWKGQAAVVIGGGPSLTMIHVEQVRAAGVRCIAVNDAYLWAPWADVNYFADASWFNAHTAGTPKPLLGLSAAEVRARFADFKGQKCSIQSQVGNIGDEFVHILRNARTDPNGRGIHATGLSLDPQALVTGSNGGFQALGLAVLAGASTVILLGIDGQPAADGRTHWSGGHANEHTPAQAYVEYRRSFSAAEHDLRAAGVRVINCSPGSAVGFERMPLTDALAICAIVSEPAGA